MNLKSSVILFLQIFALIFYSKQSISPQNYEQITDDEICSQYTDCLNCVTHFADRVCGWCGTNSSCLHNESGLNCSDWYFGPHSLCPPDPHPSVYPVPTPSVSPTPVPVPFFRLECFSFYTDCFSCKQHYYDRSCGWCENVGLCYWGTESGPLPGACNSTDWSYGPNMSCVAPSPSPSSQPTPTSSHHSSHTVAILASTISGIVVLGLVTGIIVFFIRRKSHKSQIFEGKLYDREKSDPFKLNQVTKQRLITELDKSDNFNSLN
ncbi:hypothetical protein M0811_02824 [Anaeramoeba ignava]|uniref:PSI domain-containing protein n=1 Tax=Anaeramoeba ignava TaxID=1746090 RepID=A0A9Q0L7R4_ANAIG|nr:hypothetical protein M0811_02824 [Anaeramoeba ignava]